MEWKKISVLLMVMSILAMGVVMADPMGGTLTPGASSRGTDPSATTADAQAGNVTQLNIDQTRITDIWQGFYGNVSGQIVLEDGTGNNFYDWSSSTITGEVYATRIAIADWSTIACTAQAQWEAEETALSIATDATDGINETYNSKDHPEFDVAGVTILTDDCQSTRPYNSTGLPGDFYNVLLTSSGNNIVYTAVLAEGASAFDSGTADFEILVPVDRQATTSAYYFYVELN